MPKRTKYLKTTKGYRIFRKGGKDLRKNVKRFFLSRRLTQKTPVFLYQMGKVASSSVYHSLENQYPGAVCSHHVINSDNWQPELFYNWAKDGNELKIISPIREPIGRNISAFFEWLDSYVGVDYNQSDHTIDELINVFLNDFKHEYPLTWFDDNIKKHFNIDVFKTPFPDSGFKEYKAGNVSLLVFRIDISDAQKEQIIRGFVDLPSFKLNNENVSNSKNYHVAYKSFIKRFKPSNDFLGMYKNSKYLNHFYSKNEIETIISRWE